MTETGKSKSGLELLIPLINAALATSLRDRINLLILEITEERDRYGCLVIWTAIAVIGGMQAMLLSCLGVVYLSPPDFRLFVVVGIVSLAWIFFAYTIFKIKSFSAAVGAPFEESLRQIRKDMECFSKEK